MNVGELITKLSRLDPNMPVLMQQSDDPLGDYEVLDVSVVPGKPDDIYHRSARRGTWNYPQVWHSYDGGDTNVVLLGSDKPWQPTIDAEAASPEITA